MDTRHLLDYRSLHAATLGLVVCLVVTALVYAPHVRTAGFVYEDLNDINTTYRPWQGWRVELHDAAVRPARMLTRAVDRAVGFDPVRQHATSLALHLLCGTLLFAVALAILPPLGALLAAAVFLLAPWQTEAVAYAAARADVLLTLAVLLGMLAVAHDAWALAWCAAVAAVLAKESGIAAWLLLPAWALWLRRSWPMGAIIAWGGAAWVGSILALSTRDHGPFMAPPVLAGLRALCGLLWTTTGALTIDPPTAGWWPVAVLAGFAAAGAWASPRWTTLVVGGVLLAWWPRLLLATAEPPHFHHLYLLFVALSLGVGAAFTQGDRSYGCA